MAHIRDDLPQRRRDHLEWEESDNTNEGRIETITVELTIKSEKWAVCSLYKQPKVLQSENLYLF